MGEELKKEWLQFPQAVKEIIWNQLSEFQTSQDGHPRLKVILVVVILPLY